MNAIKGLQAEIRNIDGINTIVTTAGLYKIPFLSADICYYCKKLHTCDYAKEHEVVNYQLLNCPIDEFEYADPKCAQQQEGSR